MKDIIEDWLKSCLTVKFEENVGKQLSDGVILANLLKYYSIVNEKTVRHIKPSDNPVVCENNLHQLCVWFGLLGIRLTSDEIVSIAHGKTTTTLALLYQLFLKLHEKNRHEFSWHLEDNKQLKNLIPEVHPCKSLRAKHHKLSHQYEDVGNDSCHDSFISEFHEEEEITNSLTKNTHLRIQRKESHQLPKSETLYEKMRREDIWFVRNQLKTPQYIITDKKKRLSPEYDALLESVQHIFEEQLEDTGEEIVNISAKQTEIVDDIVENTERQQFKKTISQNILHQSNYEKLVAITQLQVNFQDEINYNKFQELSNQNKKSGHEDFFSACKTSEEEIAFQLERIEKLEMHKKLFGEKIKRRNKRHLALCLQLVRDVVDFAINVAEHGNEEVTAEMISKWKQKQEMGEPLLKPESLCDQDIPTVQRNEPQIIIKEHEFDNYNHLIGDWFDASGLDVSYDEQQILGHILYRLQNYRLPKPITIEPANIPRYKITAILNCSFDELSMVKLATLLTKSKICLIDIKSTVQFCIDRYKIEADIKPPEIKSKKSKPPPKSKDGSAKTSKKGSSKKESAKKKTKTAETVKTVKDEEVQTGDSLIDNITKPTTLSDAAQLGKQLYNAEISENTSTKTMIEALVEFLRCQKDIKGWVLVNFPTNLKEAHEIEKVLSGQNFPDVFCQNNNEEETIISELVQEEQGNNTNTITHSRLVQFPVQKESTFKTYFTSFIDVMFGHPISTAKDDVLHNDYLDEYDYIEDQEEETIIDLRSIYTQQGILMNFYYETIDFKTLQELARTILQVDNIERIPSNEVFGEQVLQFYKPIDKPDKSEKKPKSSKPASKKTPKSKDELSLAKEFLEQLIMSLKLSTSNETLTMQDDLNTLDQPEIEKDEDNFSFLALEGSEFAELPIKEKDVNALISLWEQLEENYIKSVENTLSEIKEHESLLKYYENFVSNSLNQDSLGNNPDIEELVRNFIGQFNEILGNPLLNNVEQLSNNIIELEMQLWRISKEKRNTSETKRRELINHNWAADEMMEVTKVYNSLIKVEVERFNSTINVLCKYYCNMCGGIPLTEDTPQLQLDDSNLCCHKCSTQCTIAKILTDIEMNHENPVVINLQNNVNSYISEINRIRLKFQSMINLHKEHTTQTIHEFQNETKAKSNGDYNIKEYITSEQMSEEFNEEEEDIDEKLINTYILYHTNDNDIAKLFLEWNQAIKCELDRLTWRIKIIYKKAINTLDNLEKRLLNVFHKYFNDATTTYLNENKCIDELCQLLHAALNDGTPLKDDITIINNCIYLDELKFSNYSRLYNEESINDNCFKIEQLQVILEKLNYLCPNGIINIRALQYVVEDLVCEEDSENGNLFPSLWTNLTAKEFEQIWKTVFGTTKKIYWKTFLLYCLDIQFPEMEDIVSYKQQFMSYDQDNNGTISNNDFMKIKLWFQQDTYNTESETYDQNLKEFLFSMFKAEENKMDYNDFFLSFSKGSTSSIGFGKAIAFLSGKCSIVSEESEYLEGVKTEYTDMLSNMIRDILDEMIINTFNELYGVTIKELVEEEQTADTEGHKNSKLPVGKYQNEQIGQMLNSLIGQEPYSDIDEEEDEQESKTLIDKGSQTVSLSELMYDTYITKHKLFQYTTKVDVNVVLKLFDTLVYPILEFNTDDILSEEKIKQDITDSLSKLEENGVVSVVSLVKENAIQELFMATHMFEIFSFPSLIRSKEEKCC